jgi:hypothetical protein
MNTPRATVGIAIVLLAAALSLSGTPHTLETKTASHATVEASAY